MPPKTESATIVASAPIPTGLWDEVLLTLKNALGAGNHKSWIEPLTLVKIEEGTATFTAPNPFVGDYVAKTYGDQIVYHLNQQGASVERLEFERPAHETQTATPKVGKVTRPAENIANDRFTFDTFVVGKPNELAHAAARRVAAGGDCTFNPLFIYGDSGLGKTHLMHAIQHELKRASPELNVLYLSADAFTQHFLGALKDRKMGDFKEMIRSADVLMIDDLQFLFGKEKTQEEFGQAFDAVVTAQKQIVVSADRPPGEIREFDERLRSRLQSGLTVDVHATDYELRLGILEAKVVSLSGDYSGVVIEDGVLEFLALRINGNVRVLEGALNRLHALASLTGKQVNLDMTNDSLSDILRATDRKVAVEEIREKVCEHYDIRLADLIGPCRVRSLARPRQVTMFLSKQLTTCSLPEIGRLLGKRDHTTIMHGVRKIEDLRGSDQRIADDLAVLNRALRG